ncbi:hypothetical protein [Nocardia grenadensis]|uniref:hypothetical protein n=1 Tax=Nocardia grenadensis TaxID=931537 RepID=UPI0007A37B71|nr:hypothetical protein [Nocardia grenadensis]
MTPWHVVCTTALIVALCGSVSIALVCVWPAEPPPRPRPRTHPHHRVATVPGPIDWTCALPRAALSPEDAHNAARHHLEHDCPRKRAAFATLVAYGCITPDPTRRPYRRKVPA